MQDKFKKVKINIIVKEALVFSKNMNENAKQFMDRLYYLEKSKRYKEYDGYQKQEFKVFLWEVFHLNYNRYREIWNAFQFFPEESEKFGPDLVQKVKQAVGVKKTPIVLNTINKEFDRVKKIPSRQFVANVIEKHAPPKKMGSNVDTKSYWRDRAQKAESELKEAKKEIAGLKAQLAKNKPFVEASLMASKAFQDLPHLNA